jgi:transaldolase/glucose-6-phosphate isomerase
MTNAEIVERIWSRDAALWTGADEGKWLGWLDEPWRMREDVDLLLSFAQSVSGDVDDVVLLGMGGSSLAPEVIRLTFGRDRFHVLDTTHPQAIRDLEAKIDVARTLFISASKSGSTLETRSHTDYFFEQGGLWAAVTDPGSELE